MALKEKSAVPGAFRLKAGLSISVKDDFDRLIAVEHPNGDKIVNLYDYDDVRKERIFDDGEKVKSFFSGLPTVNETSSTGDSFSFIDGDQLMGFDKNGTFNYFVTDGLSSVRLLLNNSGTEIASYEHDEFGNEIAKTGSGSSPKTFVGGFSVHDDTADTDLLYMRARHYDSRLGRFLSRDPIGYEGGLNHYKYTTNPTTYIDPEGLTEFALSPNAVAEAVQAVGEFGRRVMTSPRGGLFVRRAGLAGVVAGAGYKMTEYGVQALQATEQAALAESALVTTEAALLNKLMSSPPTTETLNVWMRKAQQCKSSPINPSLRPHCLSKFRGCLYKHRMKNSHPLSATATWNIFRYSFEATPKAQNIRSIQARDFMCFYRFALCLRGRQF